MAHENSFVGHRPGRKRDPLTNFDIAIEKERRNLFESMVTHIAQEYYLKSTERNYGTLRLSFVNMVKSEEQLHHDRQQEYKCWYSQLSEEERELEDERKPGEPITHSGRRLLID